MVTSSMVTGSASTTPMIGDRSVTASTCFTSVAALDDLHQDESPQVEADGVSVVLVRHEQTVRAVGNRCAHLGLGAPIAEGWKYRGALVCPWHGSHFDLSDGRAVSGPATAPLNCFDVRVVDSSIHAVPCLAP